MTVLMRRTLRMVLNKMKPNIILFATVDAWDGEHGPVVTHGFTLMQKIPAEDVLVAINNYAFYVSEFVFFSLLPYFFLSDSFPIVLHPFLFLSFLPSFLPSFLLLSFFLNSFKPFLFPF